MDVTTGMALMAGTMVLFGALAWWADKRWPAGAPEPWEPEADAPIVIQYPLDDAPWPKKDGVDRC
ncbi:MAG TPA: hypothetical protein VM915_10930 [Verrucomicrobiae bacterium]|jgi:hypothetical protein|nr:hypothetical protein [Verrucomicrobiae bacterium]